MGRGLCAGAGHVISGSYHHPDLEATSVEPNSLSMILGFIILLYYSALDLYTDL